MHVNLTGAPQTGRNTGVKVPMAAFAVMVVAACGSAGPEPASPVADNTDLPPASPEVTRPEGGTGDGSEVAATDCSALQGETVSFVVPYSPGGGFDSYARLLAPHLAEALDATVVVENEPGAGGLLGVNNLLTADPDGKSLAFMNGIGAGAAVIAEAEGAQFSLDDFDYIGRVAAEPTTVVTSTDSPYETWIDVLGSEQPFRFGSTGPGAADYVTVAVLMGAFPDLDAEIITGFEGSGETELAVTRGEVDGMAGGADQRVPAIEAGDHRPLLVVAEEAYPAYPDTPSVLSLELDDSQRQLLQAHIDVIELGRPIIAPAGVPEDVLSCLRDALGEVMQNPAVMAEFESQGLPVEFLSGKEMEELAQRVQSAPEAYRQVLKGAFTS